MTGARTRDGLLVPELGCWLVGTRETARLAEHGLELPTDRVIELGRALVEHADPFDPTDLVPLLAQLRVRNQVQHQRIEQASARGGHVLAEAPGLGRQPGLRDGQGDAAGREVQGPLSVSRRLTVEDFLAERRDDDHDWS